MKYVTFPLEFGLYPSLLKNSFVYSYLYFIKKLGFCVKLILQRARCAYEHNLTFVYINSYCTDNLIMVQ